METPRTLSAWLKWLDSKIQTSSRIFLPRGERAKKIMLHGWPRDLRQAIEKLREITFKIKAIYRHSSRPASKSFDRHTKRGHQNFNFKKEPPLVF